MKCPSCGEEYDKRIKISMTDSIADAASMTFHQFITNYPRRCTSKIDVRGEIYLKTNEFYIYLHSKHNIRDIKHDVTDI